MPIVVRQPALGMGIRGASQSLNPMTQLSKELQPQEVESIASSAIDNLLGGLVWIGESFDKMFGGRTIRGLLAGKGFSSLNHLIPFSDTLGITDPAEAASGRDVLEKWGLLKRNKPGLDWGDVGGFAAEVLLDPASYLSLGSHAIAKSTTKVLKPLQALMRKGPLLETAADGAKAYSSGARHLKSAKDTIEAVRAGERGLIGFHKPVITTFKMPGVDLKMPMIWWEKNPSLILGTGETGAKVAEFMKYNPLARAWRGLREEHLQGKFSKVEQLKLDEVRKRQLDTVRDTTPLIQSFQKELAAVADTEFFKSRFKEIKEADPKMPDDLIHDRVFNEALSAVRTSVERGAEIRKGDISEKHLKELQQTIGEADKAFDRQAVIHSVQTGKNVSQRNLVAAQERMLSTLPETLEQAQAAALDVTTAGAIADHATMKSVMNHGGTPAARAERMAPLVTSPASNERIQRINTRRGIPNKVASRIHPLEILPDPKAEGRYMVVATNPNNGKKSVQYRGLIHGDAEMQMAKSNIGQVRAATLKAYRKSQPTIGTGANAARQTEVVFDELLAPGKHRNKLMESGNIPLSQARQQIAVDPELAAYWGTDIPFFHVEDQLGTKAIQLKGYDESKAAPRTAIADSFGGFLDKRYQQVVHVNGEKMVIPAEELGDVMKQRVQGLIDNDQYLIDPKHHKKLFDKKIMDEVAGTPAVSAIHLFHRVRRMHGPRILPGVGIEFAVDHADDAKYMREIGEAFGINKLKNASVSSKPLILQWEDVPDMLLDSMGESYGGPSGGYIRKLKELATAHQTSIVPGVGMVIRKPGQPMEILAEALGDLENAGPFFSATKAAPLSIIHGLPAEATAERELLQQWLGKPAQKLDTKDYQRITEEFGHYLHARKYDENFELFTENPWMRELMESAPVPPGKLSEGGEKLFDKLFGPADNITDHNIKLMMASKQPEVAQLGRAYRELMGGLRAMGEDAGLKVGKLEDYYMGTEGYMTRQLNDQLAQSIGDSAKSDRVLEGLHSMLRENFLKHIPGGTVHGLEKIAADPRISGVNAFKIANKESAEIIAKRSAKIHGPASPLLTEQEGVVYLMAKYGVRKRSDAKKLYRLMAALPREVANSQGRVTLFNTNWLEDMSKYVQGVMQSYHASNVIRHMTLEGLRAQKFGDMGGPSLLATPSEVMTRTATNQAISKFEHAVAVGDLPNNEITTNLRNFLQPKASTGNVELARAIAKESEQTGIRARFDQLAGRARVELGEGVRLDRLWKSVGLQDSGLNPFVSFANDEVFIAKNMPVVGDPRITRKDLVPAEIAHQIKSFAQITLNPKLTQGVASQIGKHMDRIMSYYKAGLTLPFPAFHVRNGISGQWMNAATLGVPAWLHGMKTMWDIVRGKPGTEGLWDELVSASIASGDQNHLSDILSKGELKSVRSPQNVTEFLKAPYRDFRNLVREARSVSEVTAEVLPGRAGQLRAGWEKWKPIVNLVANPAAARGKGKPSQWAPYILGQSGYDIVELFNRGVHYFGRKQLGDEASVAADWVRRVHFDYSEMSQFERKWMRRIVPFYGWMRNNLPFQIEELVTNPGGASAQAVRANRLINDSAKKEGWMPSWMSESLAFPLGKDAAGNRSFLAGNPLPLNDLNSFVMPATLGFAKQALFRTMDKQASNIHPLMKFMGEQAAGRQFYTSRPLEELRETWASRMLGGGTVMEHLTSSLPTSRLTKTAQDFTDERLGLAEKLLNFTMGMRIKNLDAADAQRYMRQDIQNYLEKQAQDNPHIRMMRAPYVLDEDWDKVDGETQRVLGAYRRVQTEITKENRKKDQAKPTRLRVGIR